MKNFRIEEYLADLSHIVSIDSGTFSEAGTNAMAEFFKKRYEELGLRAEISWQDGYRPAPFLTVSGGKSSGKLPAGKDADILMIGHMDTVFPDGTAAARPYSIDGAGHVRGPGCLDCKGGILLMYYLIKCMMAEGEIGFSFIIGLNSDEERGSGYSRAKFEELARRSGRCLVFEPGRAGGEFVRHRKGGANYTVRCRGIAAHSGVCPEKGASAILELARQTDAIYREWFRPADGTTVNIGRFDGGGDGGAVPDYAEFTVSFRCMEEKVFRKFDRYIMSMGDDGRRFDPRCAIEVERRTVRPPMVPDGRVEEMLALLSETGVELGQTVEAVSTGGGSDGNFISPCGCPTLDGCGPVGSCMHTEDEYLEIPTVEQRLDIMRGMLLRMFPVK